MFNHVRSLLLNEPADPAYPYGEEAVPAGYAPRTLSRRLDRLYGAVFGTARDRARKNWVLGLVAPVVTGRAATAACAAAGVDPRAAFWPLPRCSPPDWSVYGTTTVTAGPAGLQAYGVPDFEGPAAVTFDVIADPGGSVTVRVPNGLSRTVTPPYSGDRSAPMALAKGVRFTVPETGGTWAVRAVSRPVLSLDALHTSLAADGSWLLDEVGLRAHYAATGHTAERAGVLLVALALAVERSVVVASDRPVVRGAVIWPDYSQVYWPDNTPLFWPF